MSLNEGRTGSETLRKLAYRSLYRPGIDLAVVIALGSAVVDVVSLFIPWLVGINSEYVPGRGLTYSIAVLLSGLDLLDVNPYIVILFLPLLLALVLLFFSLQPEGLMPPRITYKMKARLLLFLAIFSSMLPAYAFLSYFTTATVLTPKSDVFVGRWELGGGATMPIFGGFGFMLALGLKIIKD